MDILDLLSVFCCSLCAIW